MTMTRPLRVAFYWGTLGARPRPLSETNPYGPLLIEAIARQGVDIRFEQRHDQDFLADHAGEIDVLHLHWPHHEYADPDRAIMEARMRAFLARLEWAVAAGYRIVWTAHNLYPHDSPHRDLDHIFRVALCRLASVVIAHCDAAADAVASTFGRTGPVVVIPHGSFIDTHPRELTREQARESLSVPDDVTVLGVFGSIDPYKGIEDLIAAVAALPEDHWLLVSGNCEAGYAATLRARMAERLGARGVLRAFDGFAPGLEVIRVLAASDICPVAFRAATTSGTVILALSWGIPVVVPAIGCLPATVEDGAGVVYDPSEPGALVAALRTAVAMDRAVAGGAALASMRRLGWDTIAAATVQAYRTTRATGWT